MYAGNYKLTHNQPKITTAAKEQEKAFAFPDRKPEVCQPAPTYASEACFTDSPFSGETSAPTDTNAPPAGCEENPVDKAQSPTKKRFKATRLPTLNEPPFDELDLTRNGEKDSFPDKSSVQREQDECCPKSKPDYSSESCECIHKICETSQYPHADSPHAGKKGGFGSLLSAFSSDELLVVALIILLLCQGGDDLLILALCFVLF